MAKSQLDQVRSVYYCSSSISNFADKLKNKFRIPLWKWPQDKESNVIFFGMYGRRDYERLLYHKGKKKVFWCGGDITILAEKAEFTQYLIANCEAKHYCENDSEFQRLSKLGINAEIRPLLFAKNPNLSYEFSETPNVYLNCHPNRTSEYLLGLNILTELHPAMTFHIYGIDEDIRYSAPNVRFHGEVSEKQFNEEIKHYQAGLRLNTLDGFSEIVAKSLLMGQPTFSSIPYKYTFSPKYLSKLKEIKTPLLSQREYWLKTLEDNKNEILNNWSW